MATPGKEILNRITVTPLAGALGAEISGIDLAQSLDAETFGEIQHALLDHLVIFFRDQVLTPEQHIAFGERFGELHVHPFIPNLDGFPEVIRLESADNGPGEMAYQSNVWHTDLTYTAAPPMASILHAIRVPEAGGDTMWNNLYMQLAGRSLIGIRDVFQALEGLQYYRPADSRNKMLEALGFTTPTGRCMVWI